AGLELGADRQVVGALGLGVLARSRIEEPSRGRRSAGATTARRAPRLRVYPGRGLRRLPRAAAGGPPPLAADAPRRGGARCAVPDDETSSRRRDLHSLASGRRPAADPGL